MRLFLFCRRQKETDFGTRGALHTLGNEYTTERIFAIMFRHSKSLIKHRNILKKTNMYFFLDTNLSGNIQLWRTCRIYFYLKNCTKKKSWNLENVKYNPGCRLYTTWNGRFIFDCTNVGCAKKKTRYNKSTNVSLTLIYLLIEWNKNCVVQHTTKTFLKIVLKNILL